MIEVVVSHVQSNKVFRKTFTAYRKAVRYARRWTPTGRKDAGFRVEMQSVQSPPPRGIC
jgi:hypothetical protein